jgi:hypothetical protein
VLLLQNADAKGGLEIRHRKVEVERLKTGVKRVCKMNKRFNHEHIHNFHSMQAANGAHLSFPPKSDRFSASQAPRTAKYSRKRRLLLRLDSAGAPSRTWSLEPLSRPTCMADSEVSVTAGLPGFSAHAARPVLTAPAEHRLTSRAFRVLTVSQ